MTRLLSSAGMDGGELHRLGRRLIELSSQVTGEPGDLRLTPGELAVLEDVIRHPSSSISETSKRTGFAQSHVSVSVSRLKARGLAATETDPADGHAPAFAQPAAPFRRSPAAQPAASKTPSAMPWPTRTRAAVPPAFSRTWPHSCCDRYPLTRNCASDSRTGRADVAGELPAADGQGDCPVRAGAQEREAGDGFELADLAGQDGVPDAEFAGGLVEAGLPGEREEPADALFGVRAGEGVPDRQRELAGCAEAGEGAGVAAHAVPDGDAGVAGRGGKALDRDAGFGGDVLETALPVLVLLAQPVRVDATVRAGAGWRSPVLVRSCLMVRSLHPVIRAILRGPYPWPVNARAGPCRAVPVRAGSGSVSGRGLGAR
jgi:Winged helix DNA-binding domain